MKSIHSALKSSRRFGTAAVCAAVALCCAGNASATPTLIDGGFETSSLTTIGTVLNDFVNHSGQWGQEASTIVTGSVGGVSPFINRMLQMTPFGGFYTQTGQAVDVSLFHNQTLTFSAWFNANDIPGAIAGVALSYYDGNDASSMLLDTLSSTIALNLSPADWQQQSVSLLVPSTATYAFVQVFFNNASLGTGTNARGFVDNAELVAVPEPGSLALAGLACLVAGSAGSARRRPPAADPA